MLADITRWATAIISLIGFGLAMGLSPTLYGATADMLARNTKVPQRLMWMLLGLVLGATILLFLFWSLDPASIVAAFRGKLDAALVNRTVDIVVASIFLVGALGVIVWKRRVPVLRTSKKASTASRASASAYFLLGLSGCIGFTTLPIMYLTGRLIAGLGGDLLIKPLAYGIFLVALVAPFVTLAWVWSRLPRLTSRVTGLYTSAASWDYRRALWILLAVAGLFFIGLAVFAGRGL